MPSSLISADAHPFSIRGRRDSRPGRASFALGQKLGLDARVTRLNLITFLAHCSCSILFLVFLNALQPFVIQQLSEGHRRHQHQDGSGQPDLRGPGALSGTLIFSDELLSTFLAPLWGAAADLFGFSSVVPIAYIFVSIGLLVFTVPSQPWPGLLFARLIFAIGGSGVASMLSAILTAFSHQQTGSDAKVFDTRLEQGSDNETEVSTGRTGPLEAGAPPAFQQRSSVEAGNVDAARDAPPSQAKATNRHGRLAALAGVFTGLGALLAVFGLLRLPQALAKYFDRGIGQPGDGATDDLGLRRATTATFVIAAALALLASAITALGLRSPEEKPVGVSRAQRTAARARAEIEAEADGDDYGAMQDSTITILSDSRGVRRTRLRHRQQQRERTGWIAVANRTLRDFTRSAAAGFRLVGPVQRQDGLAAEAHRLRAKSAGELRMAYLGGALARACTIGTTAFLPLVIAQHYYTSGICNTLPSPDPHAPLPPDAIKKLCRQAFTATAILGGTIQLTALLLSPVIGLLCDWLTPTLTLSITSTFSAVGFYFLGVGTSGFHGDARTGQEVPNPLSTLSILAAVAIGFGQIGAIVASLSGCARGRSQLIKSEDIQRALTGMEGEQQRQHQGEDGMDEADPLLIRRRRRNGVRDHQPRLQASRIGSAGSIAGAYTCCGSIAILLVSKLGGFLFDLFAPGPFLLIGGLSMLVGALGFGMALVHFCGDRARG